MVPIGSAAGALLESSPWLEHVLLNLLPAAVLLLSSLFTFSDSHDAADELPNSLLWYKLGIAGAVASTEAASLLQWQYFLDLEHSDLSVIASYVSCGIALYVLLAVLIGSRWNAFHPARITLLLISTIISDIAKMQVYMSRGIEDFSSLLWAAAICKSILILFEDDWRKSFFCEFPKVIFSVTRVCFFAGRHEDLGPEYSTEALSQKFAVALSKKTEVGIFAFYSILFQMVYAPFLIGVVARLAVVVLVFYQPELLRHIVTFVDNSPFPDNDGNELLMNFIILQIALFLLRTVCEQMLRQSAIMLRGMLLSYLSQKVMMLAQSDADRQHINTLASTDIEELVRLSIEAQRVFADYVEVIVGSILLTRHSDRIYLLSFVPVGLVFAGASLIARQEAKAWAIWEDKARQRASRTSRSLSQIQNFKTIGLQDIVSNYIDGLHTTEMAYYLKARLLTMWRLLFSGMIWTFTPITAIAGCYFFASCVDAPNPSEIFPTLAVTWLTINSLMPAIGSLERLGPLCTHITRVHSLFVTQNGAKFVASPGWRPLEEVRASPGQERSSTSDTSLEADAIRFADVSALYDGSTRYALIGATFSIKRSKVAMVIGPVGSGKSTFCRIALGETSVQSGSVRRFSPSVGFCGQTPWLRHGSIRDNIIGENSFEQGWYDAVVSSCFLNEDFRQQPLGDMTLVGSEIGNLRSGQKQRVALARAIYSRAPLIVLDDIFNSVNNFLATRVCTSIIGKDGLLRKSGTTVVLTTHSLDYAHFADQAIFLDGNGHIKETSDLANATLPNEFMARLSQSDELKRAENGPIMAQQTFALSESDTRLCELHSDLFNHLKFLFSPTKKVASVLWLTSVFALSVSERLPNFVLSSWLENGGNDENFLTRYVAAGASSGIVGFFATWFFYVYMFPDMMKSLYSTFIQCVIGSTLQFQSSSDMEYVLHSLGMDVRRITKDLPSQTLSLLYMVAYVVVDLWIVFSATGFPWELLGFSMPVLWVIYHYQLFALLPPLDASNEAKSSVLVSLRDTVDGLQHIRSFRWESRNFQRQLDVVERSQRLVYEVYTVERKQLATYEALTAFIGSMVVYVIVRYTESVSEAAAGLSVVALLTLSCNMALIIPQVIGIEKSMGVVARMRKLISHAPQEPRDGNMRLPPRWPRRGEILFRNVTVKYSPESKEILNGVSFTVLPGEKIAIIGKTGGGKTTLLRTILNFLPYTGKIEIDGLDISTVPKAKLRSCITSISQDISELEGTVRENLLPFEGQSNSPMMNSGRLNDTLELVGLLGTVQERGGLDTSLQAMNLSKGQMQLLCIARALLHNAHTESKIVLMDEATSHMDENTDHHIQAVMGEAFADCTMLVIAHRLETYHDVDRYLMLENGMLGIPDFTEV